MAIGIRQPAGGGRGPEKGEGLQFATLALASAGIAILGHKLDDAGLLHGHLGDMSYVPAVATFIRLGSYVITGEKHPLPEALLAFVAGSIWETGQGLHKIPGTFDILDTFGYGIGAASYLGMSRALSGPQRSRRR